MIKRHEPILAPSILAADFTKLGEQIKKCTDAGVTWIHCDIMDGHFVPNISYGPMIVDAANKATDAFLDVHLMIYNPDQYIDAFIHAGADQITVHQEATPHLHRSLQLIHSKGIPAGVAINPSTPINTLEEILPDADMILLMSVNPGFGGQKFIDATYKKLRLLHQMRNDLNPSCRIEIDGGVSLENAAALIHAGADILVAGNSVFGAPDISQRCKDFQHILDQTKFQKA